VIASLRQKTLARWALRWLALFVLWIALTGLVVLQELVAGAVVAAIGAAFAGLILPPARPRRAPRRGDSPVIGPLAEAQIRQPRDTQAQARAVGG
jgi:hypothetical protein